MVNTSNLQYCKTTNAQTYFQFDFILGPVRKVEVKQKKGTDSADTQSTFAFVTIEIDDRSVNQCLQEFKSQQFRGRYLQVTVARENFLEKLKREREEAAKNAPHKVVENNVNESEKINVKLPTFSSKKSSSESSSSSSSDESSDDEEPNKTNQNGLKKVKSSSSDSSDSDQEEGNLILRKKSKIFLQNGKVCVLLNLCFASNVKTFSFFFFFSDKNRS